MARKKPRIDKDKLIPAIEAILFSSGRPISISELKNFLGFERKEVEEALNKIKEEYEKRESGIEIFKFQDNYVMQIKKEFSKIAKKFAPGLDISRAALKTLSLIAIEQPVTQSKIVEIRGKHAYKHIKELVRQGYIKTEKSGRTVILKTTERFLTLVGEENIKRVKRQSVELKNGNIKSEKEKGELAKKDREVGN